MERSNKYTSNKPNNKFKKIIYKFNKKEFNIQGSLIDEIQKEMLCTECGNLMPDPYILQGCDHNFCGECKDKIKICPIDLQLASNFNLRKLFKNKIDNLLMKCLFFSSGCNWTGKFIDFQNHFLKCDYIYNSTTPCENQSGESIGQKEWLQFQKELEKKNEEIKENKNEIEKLSNQIEKINIDNEKKNQEIFSYIYQMENKFKKEISDLKEEIFILKNETRDFKID